MTRSLSTRTAELAGRRNLRAIPLVQLTTYSDRDAGTVDTVHRFSDRGLRWDSADWLPYLQRIDPLTMAMAHIPDSQGLDGSLEREARLVLRNAPLDSGVYLSEQLAAENLLFARVEISQILLDDDEGPWSIEALAAGELVTWFRGEVRRKERMRDGAEIELLLGSEIPNVPFEVLGDGSTVAPKDRGKRVPVVYGSPRRVPVLNASVGAITTTTVPLQSSGTTIYVSDTTEMPTSGSGLINGEAISWTGKTATTLTGVTRAPAPSVHNAGSIVAYIPATSKFIIGQAGCSLDSLYMRNLLNGQLVSLIEAFPTTDDADTSLTVDGGEVTSIAISQSNLRSAIQAVVRAEMDQQPDFTFTGSDVDVEVVRPLGTHTGYSAGGNYTRQFNINGSAPQIIRDFSGYSSGDNLSGINFLYDAAQAALNGRIVNRYRIVARGTFVLPGGVGSAPPTYTVTITARSSSTTWPGAGGATLSATWVQNVTGVAGGTSYDVEIVDGWITPPANTDLADFQGLTVQVQVTYSSAVDYEFTLDPTQTGVEFEIIGSGSVVQTQLARIASAAGGVALDLFADVSGPEVPSPQGDYIASSGTVISRPADIVRHFVTSYCGAPASAIDTASFDAADAAMGGTAALHTVLSDYGDTFAALAGAIAWQSRCNLVIGEGASGAVFRLFTPTWSAGNSRFEWPAASHTISERDGFAESGRDRDSVSNRFRVLTSLDRSVDGGDEESYQHVYTDGDAALSRITTAALNASRSRSGLRDHGGFFFPDLWDTATINDVASYYCRTLLEDHSVFDLTGVPWVDAFALELGDLASFDLFYKSGTLKGRVIAITKSWQTQLVDLVLVEVA